MRSAELCKGSENNGFGLVSSGRKYTGLIITSMDLGTLIHCKQFNETLVKQLMAIILGIPCVFCSQSESVRMESFSLLVICEQGKTFKMPVSNRA